MSRRVIYFEEEKFCKDCNHCIVKSVFSAPVCDKIKNNVNGEPKYSCDYHRNNNFLTNVMLGLCGGKGKYFEPKDK